MKINNKKMENVSVLIELEEVIFEGYTYLYRRMVAKDGEMCLATKNPKEYLNGFYWYSSKDEGSGSCYVVIATDNPKYNDKK